jgi:uncharacterized protein YbjT (DUF2867 family)
LVRSPESAAHFQSIGIETVLGDLTDPASLKNACAGITTLIATANAATRPVLAIPSAQSMGRVIAI